MTRDEAPELRRFVEGARAFRFLIDRRPVFETAAELRTLTARLAELYAAGLLLPDVTVGDDDSEDPVVAEPRVTVAHDYYFEMYDPLDLEATEHVAGVVSGDIAEVYVDVVRGLMLYEAGKVDDAVWDWRFHLKHHWGDHAVDALRALQRGIGRADG